MDFDQLHTFLEIVRLKSFSKAAQTCYRTQPAISAQIRQLEHALRMRATNGRRKVAIIVEADRLQLQAANAFLKTLEEPPNDSLLLLLSALPHKAPVALFELASIHFASSAARGSRYS